MKLENYKVLVSNESESKEVQGLFFELGCGFEGGFNKEVIEFEYLLPFYFFSYDDHDLTVSGDQALFDQKNHKELTIQQLRNLVAAKTKKIPYLVKTIDKWEEQQLTSDTPESATCLRIPDDAIKAYLNYGWTINFVNSDDDFMNAATRGSWVSTHRGRHAANTRGLVWKRLTQPEELPFIDDEPKMTDIEKTLNERQSQYGDFSDVAELTSDLMGDLLRNDMSFVQREALHMICSKLARMRHGDINKIDTWHDIAGYATLVVKDLEKNNG